MGSQQGINGGSGVSRASIATGMLSRIFCFALIYACLPSCAKIPFRENYGTFRHGSLHWFENEEVAYLFFELNEAPKRLVNPQWELHYGEATAGGGETERSFEPIDFDTGVHEHRVVNCEPNFYCGSFSFKSSAQISSAKLVFRYDQDSELTNEIAVDTYAYPYDKTFSSFSALLYGTFDSNNEFIRTNIKHNFTVPTDRDISRYGMTRKFRVDGVALQDIPLETIESVQDLNPPLFPASFCDDPSTGTPFLFSGESGWLPDPLDINVEARGACLKTTFLDKNEAELLAETQPAYGRRNPVLEPSDLKLLTPQKETKQVDLIIHICRDDTFADSMIDDDFLAYQRSILGISRTTPDLCFRLGEENTFESAFEELLATKVAEFKAESSSDVDIAFVVLLHELFSREFTAIQSIIASKLFQVINADKEAVSPRIIGGLVYAGSIDFQPTAKQAERVIWCPQELIDNVLDPISAPLYNQNCTTQNATEIDLRVINFITPMGPFPSYARYAKYIKDYGDRGLARNPTLKIFSIPTSVTTIQETASNTPAQTFGQGTNVTYFENERYIISQGEFARTCPELVDVDYLSFRVRPGSYASELPSLFLYEIDSLWLSESAANSYRIGISWEFPFVATVEYSTSLTGKVAAAIPFQRKVSGYEQLGEPKWLRENWDFGKYVQHCRKHCNNPFFDEAGTYQISTPWRGFTGERCPSPRIPSKGDS